MEYQYSNLKHVGYDVFISSTVEIRRPNLVEIGNHVAIDTGFYCTTTFKIKDYIHIGPYVTIIGGPHGECYMGNFTTIAAGSRIICGSDMHLGEGLIGPTIPNEYRDDVVIKPIIFEDFSSIGTNVIVNPGVTLAQGSVVGANSFVTKNTEPWTIYIGTPAKPVKLRKKDTMINYAKKLGYQFEIK
jgi:acetyltransferase-like isoleucine patch superfamily enzyme